MVPGKPELESTPAGAALAMEIGKSLKKFGRVQQPQPQITPGMKHPTLVSFFQVK
jgi:hypothetical protein